MGKERKEKEPSRDVGGDKIQCPKCELKLHKRSLERHLISEHGPKVQYLCGRCSHKNSRRDNLRAHYRDCHPERVDEVESIQASTFDGQERESHSTDGEGGRSKTPKHSSVEGSGRREEAPKRQEGGDLWRKQTPRGNEKGVKKLTVSPERKRRRVDDSGSYIFEGDDGTRQRGGEARHKRSEKPEKRSDTASCTVSKAPEEAVLPSRAVARMSYKEPAGSPQRPGIGVPLPGEVRKATETPKRPMEPKDNQRDGIATVGIESSGKIDEKPQEEVAEIVLSPMSTSQWEREEEPSPVPEWKPPSMMTQPSQQQRAEQQETISADESLPRNEERKEPSPPELRIHYLLSGAAVRITEEGHTTVVNGATQTIHEHRARHYDVVYLKAPPTTEDTVPEQSTRICRLVREEDGVVSIGPGITHSELEKIANVTKVTEVVTRSVFREGMLITKDHTQRVFDTNFVAGIR